MFEAGLITTDLRDNPVYNDIEVNFTLLLKYLKTKEKFEEHCQKFIEALTNLGGPLETVADTLKDEWKKKVKDGLKIEFNL